MNSSTPSLPRYQAFLLRIWRDEPRDGSHTAWRFSLEDPRTGVRRGFQDLITLASFIQAQTNGTHFELADSSEENNHD